VRFDFPVPGLEELSREELIVVVRRQVGQITAMAGQLSELMEANEVLAGKLARLEHLLSRNSGNSSSPPSKDDDPGKPVPPEKNKRDQGGLTRVRAETGKNRGRLCGQCLVIGGVGESGVPAPVVVSEGVVEDSGADLEQQVCPSGAPPHLLFFDQAY
jgi:uncharacterized protein DUF6444